MRGASRFGALRFCVLAIASLPSHAPASACAPLARADRVASVPDSSGYHHAEFLLGSRLLSNDWSPYEGQVLMGAGVGWRGKSMPMGLDAGWVISFGGTPGPYGPNHHSFLSDLFVGLGHSWPALSGGRFAYVGTGVSLLYGEYDPPHALETSGDTVLGGYARAGCGALRIRRTRLGLEARYTIGSRLTLQSKERSPRSVQISLLIGNARVRR